MMIWKLFKLLSFIIGLWSPSFLLTRKRLLINFPFWGEVHWISPYFSPKVLSTWFIFAWRRSEFWLRNFETPAQGLRLIAEFLDFQLLFADFFTKYCKRVFSNVGIFYPLYPIVHRDLCQESPSKRFCWSKKLSLQHFLPVKPQKLSPFSLKFTSYLFEKMAVRVIVFSEHRTISFFSCWFS